MTIATFEQAMKEAAKENISYRKSVKETWIFLDTWKTIAEEREHQLLGTKSLHLKEKLVKEHYQKDKEMKRRARRDKKKVCRKPGYKSRRSCWKTRHERGLQDHKMANRK